MIRVSKTPKVIFRYIILTFNHYEEVTNEKIIALLLVVAMVVSMAACSTEKKPSNDTVKQEGETKGSDSEQGEKNEDTSKEIPTLTMLTFTDW